MGGGGWVFASKRDGVEMDGKTQCCYYYHYDCVRWTKNITSSIHFNGNVREEKRETIKIILC